MKKKQLLCVLLTGLMLLVPYSGVLAEEAETRTEETEMTSGADNEEEMVSGYDQFFMAEGQEYELDLDDFSEKRALTKPAYCRRRHTGL